MTTTDSARMTVIPPCPAERPGTGTPRWPALAIVAVVAAAYANALANGFVWDDINLIVSNPAIKRGDEALLLFMSPLLPGAEYYRPLQALTYLVDYHLWGLWPAGFHLTNVALHGLVAVLFYRLTARVLADWRAALCAAVLFAVHPLHTEAVSYVSGRTDPLAAAFMLAALLWTLDARPILAGAAFALALLARESAVVLPLLVVLVARAGRHGERPPGSARARYGALLLVLGAWVLLREWVVERRVIHETSTVPLGARLLTLPETILTYLRLLALPVDLHMERSLVPARPDDAGTWAALAVVLGLGGVAIALRARAWPVAFGVAWFTVALLPVANIVPLATFVAEHWVYVPSMGIFLAAGWGLSRLAAIGRRRAAHVVLAVAVLSYGARTVRRNMDWHDERTLLEATLRYAPGSARVHSNLGRVYHAAGDITRAKAALARALELEPNHVRASDAHNLLGIIAQREGDLEDAVRHYQQAIALNARPSAAYTNLASALQELGRPGEARHMLETALRMDPRQPIAHMNLGNLAFAAGDLAAAERAYAQAIALDPDYAPAQRNLGRLYLVQRRGDLAERAFRRALTLEPGSEIARRGLESALRMQAGNGADQ